jgi:hypothetical protein
MNAQVEPLLTCPITLSLEQEKLNLAKKCQLWESIKDFYYPIINSLQYLGIEPKLSNDIDISFTGDAKKLATVIRIFRTHGFTSNSARPKQRDTSWVAFYTHPECPTRIWLSFTSSVCQRVKVGTRLVEENIYEVRCGDISEASLNLETASTLVLLTETDNV